MSALTMILAATVMLPANGPEMVSGEVEQDRELDLRGEWRGMLTCGGQSEKVILTETGTFIVNRWSLIPIVGTMDERDERGGKFCFLLGGHSRYVGIYEWRGDSIALCFRKASKGRPTSFEAGEDQYLVILHRVKPRK